MFVPASDEILKCLLFMLSAPSAPALLALLARTPFLLPSPLPSNALTRLRCGTLCLRDDLLPGAASGSKARKLDALLPDALRRGASDLLTLGGLHSSHTAAVAASAAALGLRAHVLLRGERPERPVGHTQVTLQHAHSVSFVSRDAYADRDALLAAAAAAVAAPSRVVVVVPEGAACALGCLGTLRAVAAWAASVLDPSRRALLVADTGTGASAYALALGCRLLGLPWHVLAVPVGCSQADGEARIAALARDWDAWLAEQPDDLSLLRSPAALPLTWAPRPVTRFGAAPSPSDVAACRALAEQGVPADPVWTLHAFRAAAAAGGEGQVAWVHAGGVEGAWAGVAQRWPHLAL